MRRSMLPLASAALLLSAPALAQQTAPAPRYDVTAEIRVGGTLVGTPSLLVTPGTSATVSNDAEDGYSLKVTLGDSDEAAPPRLALIADLRLRNAAGWTQVGTPSMLVTIGDDASIVYSPDGGPETRLTINVQRAAQ